MKSPKASGMLRLLALSIIAGPFAMAQDSGWYIGANVGQSKAKIDDGQITNHLLGAGFTSATIDDRNHDLGFKLFGGYEFNRYFSLEAGYFDLGKFGYTATTVPAGTLDGNLKVKGLDLDAVLNIPFTKRFSGLLRVGVISAQTKDSFTGTGAVVVTTPNPTQNGTNYKYGAGLQYDFTKSFGMRAEVERYRINDAVSNKGDIDLASLGVVFRFGRGSAAPAQPAPAPAPEPVAPAPAAVEVLAPVVVAPPAKTQEYCTILDLTFEIDQDAIERDDKEKLKVVGTFLTRYPQTTAVIEGHSDNVGNSQHNMNLSLARAENVVAYLVDQDHIDRSRLKAVGYGDSRPIADNATEEGKRSNRRINAVVPCVTDIEGLTVVPSRVTMALELEFDKNSDVVKPQYREDLHKVANFLKANPGVKATLEGHTGNTQATPELAMEISLHRAQNVAAYLVDNFGIERSRLTSQGYGRTRQTAYNATAEGRTENRRVNIIINYPKK